MITCTKRVELDAGHRVPNHESKCANLHGHRYAVELTVVGGLRTEGAETGMVMDFGRISTLLKEEVHDCHDHALLLYVEDPVLAMVLEDYGAIEQAREVFDPARSVHPWPRLPVDSRMGRVVILPVVPTAEALAELWGNRLAGLIWDQSRGSVQVHSLTVHETPTCHATWRNNELMRQFSQIKEL